MKCQRCGKELNDDFQVCPYCGSPVVRTNQPEQQFQQGNSEQQAQQPRQTQPMPQRGSYNSANMQNAQPQKKSNAVGVLALILGIAGILLSCIVVGIIPAIIAIILGVIGIVNNKGKGMSIAGLVCGAVGFVIFFGIMLSTDPSDSTDTATDTKIESQSEIDTEQIIEEDSEIQPVEETETQAEVQDSEIETEDSSAEEETPSVDERQAFIDSCEEFDYKQIARNPDDYVGKNFKVTVQVFSKSEGSFLTSSYLKAYTDDGSGYYYDHLIYIYDEQDENSPDYVKPLEEDIITVYGTFEEMVETTNFINGEKGEEIALHMKYADLISE